MAWAWVVFTLLAAAGQVMRNAMQRSLTETLGTVGATHVRFLYGLPFGLLFVTLVCLWLGTSPPPMNAQSIGWTVVGAVAQIVATALLLAAMQQKSFVIVTALSKTEPVHVALFSLVLLGEHLSTATTLAIVVATAGVLLMSWPQGGLRAAGGLTPRPVLLGILSGAVFGLSAVGYRRGILALGDANFVLRASTTLALALTMQTILLSGYLLATAPATLKALFKAWRPSILAGLMGAAASQLWFLAFAVETAAKVRTLALVEILYAGFISRKFFAQGLNLREAGGIALMVIGVIVLLNQ